MRLFAPGRRALLLFPLLLSLILLGGCGGGEDLEEIRHPELRQERQRLGETARASLAGGLVGVLYGSQHEALQKLYLATAGLERTGGAALSEGAVFQIGSLAKSMTAALAAEQVRQGRLRWDSRPADWLPELAGRLHPAYAGLTLAHLLDHRGGLPALQDPAELENLAAFLAAQPEPLPNTDRGRRRLMSRWLLETAPASPPGQEVSYSNAGYVIAGALLEAATGQDFDVLLRNWAQGLGLELRQGSAVPGHQGASPAALAPYQPLPPPWHAWVDGAMKPAGNAWLDAAGYGHWLAEHQRALQGKRHGLAPDYVQRLRELPEGGYALGWSAGLVQGRRALVHTGAYAGFMGMAWLQQDGKKSFFALSNTEGGWVLEALTQGLLQLALR
ncbi:serine hydrolase [Paucibacter sp. PLA-PC-4]|uniref:serine hydrolase domain-containing protein n=1 Tax=Paucibacter sp. PLA-PC-4 TaxID=2993655 RepID=UPI00224B159E|nr:serine hydrolase domain-containing protein [Paucibacter sp. PLA-PC-4]MCX2864807.1 serine hydrolase [Paucibacter sp. PLA-PC-4]